MAGRTSNKSNGEQLTNGAARQARFLEWNHYAAEAAKADDLTTTDKVGLAIAYELSQVRAAIHFAGQR